MDFHPLCLLFPKMSDADLKALADDIQLNGLNNPIITLDGQILDGRNRFLACGIAKVKPTYCKLPEGKDPLAFVLSQNLQRRHLDRQHKRKLIAAVLEQDPSLSDRRIGEMCAADHKTVAAVRDELESTGEIPQLTATVGKDGRTRSTARQPAAEPESTEEIPQLAAEPEPDVIRDAQGRELSEKLQKIFGDTSTADFLKVFRAYYQKVRKNRGLFFFLFTTRFTKLCAELEELLEDSLPHSLCPTCDGRGFANKVQCRECHGRGYWSRGMALNQPDRKEEKE